MFADSSFYDDPKHKYPTIAEQVKMARKVAQSLTAPMNVSARGHQMFIKRKEKSDKWSTDFDEGVGGRSAAFLDSDSEDLYYNPTPWAADRSWSTAANDGLSRKTDFSGTAAPIGTHLFAPNLGRVKDDRALSAEEFERMRLYEQKTTHDTVAPQVCFSIANDLKQMKGKGGRLFAKHKARSDKFVVGGDDDEDVGESRPNPNVLEKLSNEYEHAPHYTRPAAAAESRRRVTSPPATCRVTRRRDRRQMSRQVTRRPTTRRPVFLQVMRHPVRRRHSTPAGLGTNLVVRSTLLVRLSDTFFTIMLVLQRI